MSVVSENRPEAAEGAMPAPPKKPRDTLTEVVFLKKRIEARKTAEDFVEWDKLRKDAKKFYKGDLLDESDVKSWEGDEGGGVIVQVNMWRRILSFMVDAVFSMTPNIVTRSREGRQTDEMLASASSVEAMLKYVWDEMKQQPEVRRVLKDAWFGNIAAAKITYDKKRGLFGGRWCPGMLVVDAECHGDLRRAMWAAEEMSLPALQILRDETFPREKRAKLAEKWQGLANRTDGETLKKIWYVYTREGANPWSILSDLLGEEGEEEEATKKKLLVICEDFDDYLLEAPDPCPYLDEDEIPYPILVLDEMPGELYGSPFWKMLKGLIDAINWLLTFFTTSMKKQATNITLVNKNIFKGRLSEFTGASNAEALFCDGDPSQATARVDLGKGDLSSLTAAEGLHDWLAKISGFNEVAQGESTGRKTAEEARYLQQNTSLVTKGASQSLDAFIEEWLRMLALATIYYIPQFSWVIGPDGQVMTGQVQDVPQGVDPATGQPVMGKGVVPVPVAPEMAQEVGAKAWDDGSVRMPDTQVETTEPSVDELGQPVAGVPMFTHERAGEVLRKGVDFFIGQEKAMAWPTGKLEDVKRDLDFSFEAGSTRADFRNDQQQAATMALQVLGPMLQQAGGFEQMYEFMVAITKSLPLSNTDRLIMPRAQFIQGMGAAMQAAQMANQPPAEAPEGPPPPNPAEEAKVKGDQELKKYEIDTKAAIEREKIEAACEQREAGGKAEDGSAQAHSTIQQVMQLVGNHDAQLSKVVEGSEQRLEAILEKMKNESVQERADTAQMVAMAVEQLAKAVMAPRKLVKHPDGSKGSIVEPPA